MAKANLTTTADIQVTARELDFVTRFEANWEHLRDILGIMRPIKKMPGAQLKSKYAEGTLQSGAVAEGDEIVIVAPSKTAIPGANSIPSTVRIPPAASTNSVLVVKIRQNCSRSPRPRACAALAPPPPAQMFPMAENTRLTGPTIPMAPKASKPR